jgi:hypothetical protein
MDFHCGEGIEPFNRPRVLDHQRCAATIIEKAPPVVVGKVLARLATLPE